jgi:hypothetical protein
MYEDGNYADSNHGVMTDLALIQIAMQFRGVNEYYDKWISKAQERLSNLIVNAFDEDGLNNENTIGYHSYNLSLYKLVVEYLKHYGVQSDFVDRSGKIIPKAEEALSYCVWQDGSVPPIGDSPVKPNAAKSINSSKWFKKSNLLIVKNDSLYLSLICGLPSPAHKHVDDTSITLRYKNEDIIVDGGSLNYDRENPIRLCLESCRGHSGVFVSSLNGVLSHRYVNDKLKQAGISNYYECKEYAEAQCYYVLNNSTLRIERYIRINFPDEVIILDTTRGKNEDDGSIIRQQFLFGPKLSKVDRQEGFFILEGKVVKAAVLHLSISEVDWFKGEMKPITRGWYSAIYYEAIPTLGVDFNQRLGGNYMLTVIKLFDREVKPEFKPSNLYLDFASTHLYGASKTNN